MSTDLSDPSPALWQNPTRADGALLQMLDNLPVLIAYVDAEDRYRFANAPYLRWVGRSREELLGRSVGEILARRGLDAACQAKAAENRRRVRSGERLTLNETIPGPHRPARYLRIEYVPEHSEPGAPRPYYILIHDVTDLKRAELEVLSLQGKLRRLLDSNLIGVVFYDLRGSLTDANDAFLNSVGYSRADLAAGRLNWIEMTPPEWREADRRAVEQLSARGECDPYEKEYIRRDGRRIPILLGCANFEDSAYEGVAFILDISSLKQTQAALEAAVSSRDEFISIASHELRTPIASMKLQVQMLSRALARGEPLPPERLQTMLQQSDRSLNRLTRLVDDMLDISRIQAGRLPIEPQPVELDGLVAEALERALPQLQAAGISVDSELAPGLTAMADRQRIEQVLHNLLSNAARYAPNAPVAVRLARRGEHAVLEVADGGPGIPAENHERIFQRFERLAPAAHAGGLGLGLYIVREIVRAHGGEVRVESEPGQGARFIVSLPLSTTAESPDPAA